MSRLSLALALALALALPPAVAAADETAAQACEDHIDDPLPMGWRESGIDAPRSGCLHADVGADLSGRALIDTPDFYGTLGGDLTLRVRITDSDHFEWGFALRALDAVFVQNAVLTVDELGYGPISAHAALGGRHTLGGKPLARAFYARLEAPFTRSRLDGSSGALQLGAAGTWLVAEFVRLHGHASALGWYASSNGGRDGRAAVGSSIDVSVRLYGWLSVSGGADVQLGWYGVGLDHVAVRAGAHWRVKGLWRTQLVAGLPLAGAERTDVAFSLGVRRDLD